ncbi:putative transport system kinase [Caenibius tardaugens NBRC 16725]|uniref:Putative transport system kinase n=1 Tax=Caenibius tardaugens NBRC 16725 TaxID=1219035 RepID=U2YJS3_9SPHN|nr:methylmalonyl Co-A mutase-associated GTPase MeaB [Caenibius tardaugens]AZI34921.1 methylmalonyl Co-A mutase-associated GTPase MeaB [Caenibius tardaugens NBRC 16725]GAD48462.1 putative transport system kinase [Caenibius tardaugens NBRC 16725]
MGIAADLLEGKIAAGARAITWLDDGDPRGAEVIKRIFAETGRAHIIGITGPPGAGKSTLTNVIVGELRARYMRVGVVAIDPSSPFTGGAILGDRVRMGKHTLDPGVFIRSIGTRGAAGGLSRSTHDACLVLDAMGFDAIIVETVGVGQDEIDVVNLAHTTIIVGVPGLGDEVQAVKAGILEAGEIFVINKADRDGYEATLRQFELMLHLREQSRAAETWHPPLLRAVANVGEGGAQIVDAILGHRAHLDETGGFARRSGLREREQVLALLRERLARQAIAYAGDSILADVEARKLDPYSAVEQLTGQGA